MLGDRLRAALKIATLWGLVSMAGFARASSLVPNDRWQGWSLHEGLPTSFIEAVTQTSDGYIWFGSEQGISRFDGLQVKTYFRESVPELFGTDVYAMLGSNDNDLWVGTGTGLVRLHQGRFKL